MTITIGGQRRRVRLPQVIAVTLATAALTAGCSSDRGRADGSAATHRADVAPTTTIAPRSTTTTMTSTSTSASMIDVRLDRYAIEPAELTATAGTVRLAVVNADRVVHDVVLLRTDRPIDELPTVGIRIAEDDPAIEVLARTPRLDPGQAGQLAAELAPGRYVLVCTVPHHYVREAMAATLTVTG